LHILLFYLVQLILLFFGLEIILHFITLYATKSNLDKITSGICLRDYGCFPVRVLFYGLIYSSPIVFLFLSSDSQFRQTYYEILLVLNVFFGVSYIDLTFEPLCASESEPSEEALVYRIWTYITLFIYNILAIIIMITTMVFAGQAIRRNATGEEILPSYDFGVYIYCLVNYGLLALGQLCNCCNMCVNIATKGSSK
jgi:hypothetical protein